MIEQKLIDMLRCPSDGGKLLLAENSLVQQVNQAIGRGQLRDAQDQKITLTIDQGLLNAHAQLLYPIRGGIPALIRDEAIDLNQLQ